MIDCQCSGSQGSKSVFSVALLPLTVPSVPSHGLSYHSSSLRMNRVLSPRWERSKSGGRREVFWLLPKQRFQPILIFSHPPLFTLTLEENGILLPDHCRNSALWVRLVHCVLTHSLRFSLLGAAKAWIKFFVSFPLYRLRLQVFLLHKMKDHLFIFKWDRRISHLFLFPFLFALSYGLMAFNSSFVILIGHEKEQR